MSVAQSTYGLVEKKTNERLPAALNDTDSYNRSDGRTVDHAVKAMIDAVEIMLLKAKCLGGARWRIPTWKTLMAAWDRRPRRCGTCSAAVTRTVTTTATDTRTPPNWQPAVEEMMAWAFSAPIEDLLDHPAVQVALYRGVVVHQGRQTSAFVPEIQFHTTPGTGTTLSGTNTQAEVATADVIDLVSDEETDDGDYPSDVELLQEDLMFDENFYNI